MALSENSYQLSVRYADSLVDRAMVEALATADSSDLPVLFGRLLQRSGEEGLAGLVRYFHLFRSDLQDMLTARADDLGPILRRAVREPSIQSRQNAMEIIRSSRRREYLDVVCRQLTGSNGRLMRSAAEILSQWTAWVCDDSLEQLSQTQRKAWLEALGRAVEQACRSYDRHRRGDVIRAACRLGAVQPDWLTRFFNEKCPAATAALGAMIDRMDSPEVVAIVLGMLGHPVLGERAARALARPKARRWVGTMLGHGRWLERAEVRGALRTLGRADHLTPGTGALEDFSIGALRCLPQWLEVLALEDGQRIAALARVAVCRDGLTRLACLRRLIDMRCDLADEAVAAFCFDGYAPVAVRALRWLARRRWNGMARMLVRRVGGGNPTICRLAERQLARLSFDRLWRKWPAMSPTTRAQAGRAWLKIDRDARRKLTERLKSTTVENRSTAIAMARQLGLAGWLRDDLIACLEDAQGRVASAAASALGDIDADATVVRALVDALDHSEDRVRSNVIESLARLGRLDEVAGVLADMIRAGGNRSRATALRMVLRHRGRLGEPALGTMLGDPRAAHRLSALWVVGQLPPLVFADRVVAMAHGDANPQVRRRAGRLVCGWLRAGQPGGATVRSAG